MKPNLSKEKETIITTYISCAQALIDLSESSALKNSVFHSQTCKNFINKSKTALISNLNKLGFEKGDIHLVEQTVQSSSLFLNTFIMFVIASEKHPELINKVSDMIEKEHPEIYTEATKTLNSLY